MQAEALNLPTKFAKMFKGKQVELSANKNSLIIKTVEEPDIIDKMCGMIKSDGHRVERFIQRKQEELALEDEKSRRRAEMFAKRAK
jgi:virulence-associated protein VagC